MTRPVSLDALLLDERLVDDAALRQAKRVALRRRVPLLEVLVDEHTVDGERLADLLAQRLDLPRLRLTALTLDEEAIREVPHDLAAAHQVVPVHLDSSGDKRTLQLAMANPLDTFAIEDVAHCSGCTIDPGVATLTDVRAAILRSYRGMITRMIPRLPSGDDGRPLGDPTTQPHLQLPDESSLVVRLRAVVELLVEHGVLSAAEVEDRVRRIARGEDV